MDQEKRLLLAMVLTFAIMILWRVMFAPPPKKGAPGTAPAGTAPATAASQPASTAPVAAKPVVLPVEQAKQAREIVIENGLYRITLSSEGAVVRSWVLKKYLDDNNRPLDVVNQPACQKLGYPFKLALADSALNDKLNSALYVATPSDAELKPPATVEFVYSDGKIQARKQFVFGPDNEVRAEVSLFDGTRHLPAAIEWPGGFGDHSLPPEFATLMQRAVFSIEGKVGEEHLVPSFTARIGSWLSHNPLPAPERTVKGPLGFAGLEDRYFAGIWLPESDKGPFSSAMELRLARRAWREPEKNEKEAPKPLDLTLASEEAKPLAFRLFVAPKDLDVLRAVRPPLDGLVDFGWFSIIAKPLFLILRFLKESWTHNYGWAIIILTVIINFAMFPLRLKSIRSAQEMQKLGPKVNEIKERYNQYKFNDPRKQRMQQETMKLYQEHGVNPLSGCLPMALQLPVLYGFYNVLNLAIELRHAPWIWWVKDLSSPDTVRIFGTGVHLLPLAMIISQYLMQKMTPTPTIDPGQQRMMALMPLIFGFMFYSLASGLTLYWLTQNLVGIGQQVFINRTMPQAQAPSGRGQGPSGEGAMKSGRPAERKPVGVK